LGESVWFAQAIGEKKPANATAIAAGFDAEITKASFTKKMTPSRHIVF
jgi:hypothetical protein